MQLENLYACISTSVKNEIVVNDSAMSILRKSNFKTSFPGASRLNSWGLNTEFEETLLSIVYYFWPIFLSIVTNFIYFFKCLYFSLRLEKCSGKKLPRNLIFASGQTTLSVVTKAIGEGHTVLYKPRQKGDNSKNTDLDCLQLLSAVDLVQILCYSIFFSIRYSYDPKFRKSRLYSVFFFDLITVVKAFEKIEGLEAVYTGDHFDRWAVLLDSIAVDKKNIKKFCVVQHGSLKNSEGLFPIELAVRLKSVDCLYCFDESSYVLFKENVIDSSVLFSCTVFNNSIALMDFDREPGLKYLLIVGNSLFIDFHASLAEKLCTSEYGANLKVLYKPHPTQIGRSCGLDYWEVIENNLMFPKVDFVVSYPSTLVEQYREKSIHVCVHSMDVSVSQEEFFNVVKLYLKKLL